MKGKSGESCHTSAKTPPWLPPSLSLKPKFLSSPRSVTTCSHLLSDLVSYYSHLSYGPSPATLASSPSLNTPGMVPPESLSHGWSSSRYLREWLPHLFQVFGQTSSQGADLSTKSCILALHTSLPPDPPSYPAQLLLFIHTTYLPWLYHIIHTFIVFIVYLSLLNRRFHEGMKLYYLLMKIKCHQ